VLLGVLGVLAVVTAALFATSGRSVPAIQPDPAASYDEAIERVEALTALDGPEIMRPTLFFDQGDKVETSVVIFHGFTNNPEQFERIGQAYAEAGYNVLIPRLPDHGERDLLTRDLSEVTAAKLAETANEAVDIAAGLGERVEVVGLSGGGNLAALMAHDRDEVAEAVVISPLFGVDMLPGLVTRPIVAWSRVLPDFYFWWDPIKKADHVPADAYPNYSLKSISAFFEVAYDFMRREPSRSDGLDRVVIVTNGADRSVDESLARESIGQELRGIAGQYEEYEYPAELGYAHDLIDPQGSNATSIEAIYRTLYPYLGLAYTEPAQ
jgi:esterase/lipase